MPPGINIPSGIVFSGAGGNRTRVQTRNRKAFYMLILLLIFESGPVTNNLPKPYLLNFIYASELCINYPILDSTTGSKTDRRGFRVMARFNALQRN